MKDSNIHVIELSAYTRPEITESKQRDWIHFGNDNNFPKYLIDRYINSPTNSTVINSIAAQVYGHGLDAFDKAQKPDEYAAMTSLFQKKDLKQLILDVKILGMGALQISYKGKKVDQVTHFPMETLRPEKCNDKGEIEAWYYHPNWSEAKRNDKPTRIPVFGSGSPNEIYVIKKYCTSMTYMSLPDNMGSMAYCELEENISDYLLNTVNNSFSASKLINFPNGLPSRDKMMEIKQDVVRKLTSQHGDKIIVSFSESKDQAPEVIDLPIADAAQTYEWLSEECSRKIMIGHRVTSPLLLGLRDGNSSLGSNADEIINASRLFTNVTIKPYQDQIVDCLDEIMAVNGLSLDMYFKTLEPLEFREADNSVITQEQEESDESIDGTVPVAEVAPVDEELQDKVASYNGAQIASALSILENIKAGIITEDQAIVFLVQMLQFDIEVARAMFSGDGSNELSVALSKKKESTDPEIKKDERPFLSDENGVELFSLIDELGEDEDLEHYEIIDMDSSEDEPEDFDVEAYLNGIKLTANQDSSQDNNLYKVRYKYVKATRKQGESSRPFCKKMMSSRKVYRKEDITMMSFKGINKEFGHKGKNYSIWLHGGGINCHHAFNRVIYKKRLKADGSPWGGSALDGTNYMNVNQAVREGFKLPKNDPRVAKASIDRSDRGMHPNNPNR